MIIEELLDVLGRYEPITVENVLADGSIVTYYTPDWGYIIAGSIVLISVYCVFRLLGSFFAGGKKK